MREALLGASFAHFRHESHVYLLFLEIWYRTGDSAISFESARHSAKRFVIGSVVNANERVIALAGDVHVSAADRRDHVMKSWVPLHLLPRLNTLTHPLTSAVSIGRE